MTQAETIPERLVRHLTRFFKRFPVIASALTLFTFFEVAIKFSGLPGLIAEMWKEVLTVFWRKVLFFAPPISKEIAIEITLILTIAPVFLALSKREAKEIEEPLDWLDRFFYALFFIPLYLGVDQYLGDPTSEDATWFEILLTLGILGLCFFALIKITLRVLYDSEGNLVLEKVLENLAEAMRNKRVSSYVILGGQVIFIFLLLLPIGYVVDWFGAGGFFEGLLAEIRAAK